MWGASRKTVWANKINRISGPVVTTASVHCTSISAQIESSPCISETTCSGWLIKQIPLRGARKGLRPLLCKWLLLLPFISTTSHQNSSPSEVAAVPPAIKIMLGHAMVMCDSTVGNKSSSSSSRGNDASRRVVNLEQCQWKPSLWFLREAESRPRLDLSVRSLLEDIKQQTARNSIISSPSPSQLSLHCHNTKKGCAVFFLNPHYLNRFKILIGRNTGTMWR